MRCIMYVLHFCIIYVICYIYQIWENVMRKKVKGVCCSIKLVWNFECEIFQWKGSPFPNEWTIIGLCNVEQDRYRNGNFTSTETEPTKRLLGQKSNHLHNKYWLVKKSIKMLSKVFKSSIK